MTTTPSPSEANGTSPGASSPPMIGRRDFVRHLPVLAAGLAAGGASASLTGCAGTPYVTPRVGPGTLTIPASVLAETGDVFLQAPGMERPIYVRRSPSGESTAVLASCTHRGCQPEPAGDRLACPCHGSEFSFGGEVLAGPADRPLARFPVHEQGESIVIRVGDRREGP